MADLSKRQAEITEWVAMGLPDKWIAQQLEISVRTVQRHIQDAAKKMPGPTTPRHRLTLFFLTCEKSLQSRE